MAATPTQLYSVTPPVTYPNIFGNQLYPLMPHRVLLKASLVPNPTQDNSSFPNVNLVRAGTPIGIVTVGGKAVIAASAAADGSQVLFGILAADYDTSIGDQVAIVWVTGDFDINSIKFQGTDTLASFLAGSPKINNSLYFEDSVVAPAPAP